jgi:hypothetical protein
MTTVKHAEALAIAQRGSSVNWDMGDYLLSVAGKPQYGNGDKIAEVSEELVEHGFAQYTQGYMMTLRNVAFDFPIPNRVQNVAWTTHQVAGTPEVLSAVIEAAKAQGRKVGGKKGEGVSKRFVQQVIDGLHADSNAQRRGAEIRARKDVEQAEKEAQKAYADKQTAKRLQDADKYAAAQKREETALATVARRKADARTLKGAPKRSKAIKPPKPEDVPLLVTKTKFAADSAEAKALVKRMDKAITPHIDDLTKPFIVGSVEELLEIAELFRKLAAKLNRNQTEKRAHLHAVA